MYYFIFLFLIDFSSASTRSVSLFQLSFEDVLQKLPPSDIKGVTPADTYPLIIKPLSFAPAVVAPLENLFPSHLFGTKNMVLGAIPIFKPLQSFPYIKYLPVSTSFYLNEPNVRNPFASSVGDDFPSKVSAPKPAFLPIQDVQISRRPSKDKLINEIEASEKNTLNFEKDVIIRGSVPLQEEIEDNSQLKFAAPGGIAQSTQPYFESNSFKNSKVSLNLLAIPRMENGDEDAGVTVIEV